MTVCHCQSHSNDEAWGMCHEIQLKLLSTMKYYFIVADFHLLETMIHLQTFLVSTIVRQVCKTTTIIRPFIPIYQPHEFSFFIQLH